MTFSIGFSISTVDGCDLTLLGSTERKYIEASTHLALHLLYRFANGACLGL